jgi:hypothetical protein
MSKVGPMSETRQHRVRDPDNSPPSGPFTHWIDTNVMLEIYSHGDLYEAYENTQRGKGAITVVEERRMRMQGTLWMAMALCTAGARSVTYQHDNLRNILRLAPPRSTRGAWTSAILYVLGDGGVFDGWERYMTSDGETLTNRQRDAHMIQECCSEGLVLVTRDAQVIGEAKRAGVDATEPEPFAARYLARDDARRVFGQRLGGAAIRYLVAGSPQEQNMRMRVGRTTREVYSHIWRPLEQPVFM